MKQLYFRQSTERAFTLIELLVVIAIIGLLSSVVIASMNSARKKARDARRKSDLKQVQIAAELFFDDNNYYPGYTNRAIYYWWVDDNNFDGGIGGTCTSLAGGLRPYFPNICEVKGPGAERYVYAVTMGGELRLCARFELTENQTIPCVYGSGDAPVSGYYEKR